MQFAAHLLAQHASCLACQIQCDSDSERNALSPIIPISDRLPVVTPGILCSLRLVKFDGYYVYLVDWLELNWFIVQVKPCHSST